jgi:hypothetical protein
MREEMNVRNGSGDVVRSTTEIVGKARRRQFSAAYIDRILQELDEAPHGEGGRILRREGLYSNQVSTWRKQRLTGVESKRGRKPELGRDLKKRNEQQQREIARLQRKLMQAEKIIEVQKKVSELLGVILPSDEVR